MKINDGGSAFPEGIKVLQDKNGPNDGLLEIPKHMGMTRRQWLAGMAMSGWLADPNASGPIASVVKGCYAYADAMIAFEESEDKS